MVDTLGPLVSEDVITLVEPQLETLAQLAVRGPHHGHRSGRGSLVGLGIRRRVRPRDEPDLRDRRGPSVLEAAPGDAGADPDRRRPGRGRAADAGRLRPGGGVHRRRRSGSASTAVTVWEHRQVAGAAAGRRHCIVALLYYATPNVQQPKFRWISVGAFVAIVVVGDRVGGVRASTWPTSPATTRPTARWPASSWRCCGSGSPTSRCCSAPSSTPSSSEAVELQAGIPAEEELQLPARDTRNIEKQEKQERKDIALGRKIRTKAERNGATHDSDQPHDSKEETR